MCPHNGVWSGHGFENCDAIEKRDNEKAITYTACCPHLYALAGQSSNSISPLHLRGVTVVCVVSVVMVTVVLVPANEIFTICKLRLFNIVMVRQQQKFKNKQF